ncbi:hypothetical protein THRCLA_07759 [Thraustotheca clavata]|uniref:Transmembrane protein n=1 Tax=Thraustotheca clavata TaxID=74557 RepID=A0A1V9ZC92_9STRA|nr:hypothetical protein THRCLA_07759 [Thraustotheca clavata]
MVETSVVYSKDDERAPWLADVNEAQGVYGHIPVRDEDLLIRCSGILSNGSRCTRTCVIDRSVELSSSYCYKHHAQATVQTHGYAPLTTTKFDLQTHPSKSNCGHWTYLAILAFSCTILALVCLVLAFVLHTPVLGIFGVLCLLFPILLLGYCLVKMMSHVVFNNPSKA